MFILNIFSLTESAQDNGNEAGMLQSLAYPLSGVLPTNESGSRLHLALVVWRFLQAQRFGHKRLLHMIDDAFVGEVEEENLLKKGLGGT